VACAFRGVSGGMVPFVPADEANLATVLEGEHPPAVNLLLVDPSFRVEWLRDLGRVHEVRKCRD
jgi:hypothetical protein